MIWDEYSVGATREASKVPLIQFSGPAAHGRPGELEKKKIKGKPNLTRPMITIYALFTP
jgi:hypothetical protein